jgi:hypothetical protein
LAPSTLPIQEELLNYISIFWLVLNIFLLDEFHHMEQLAVNPTCHLKIKVLECPKGTSTFLMLHEGHQAADAACLTVSCNHGQGLFIANLPSLTRM